MEIKPAVRPSVLEGRTHKYKMGCGNVYVTVNRKDGRPIEVFCAMGKEGGCSAAFVGSASRAISQALRAGVEVKEVVKQQSGIQCGNGAWNDGVMVKSCPDAIALTLRAETERIGEEGETGEDKSEEEVAMEAIERERGERKRIRASLTGARKSNGRLSVDKEGA